METLLQDVRYGLRILRKNPGFTIVALLVLTLGIGANTAIFSVVNAVLLRSLPYPHAERLVAPVSVQANVGGISSVVPYRDYMQWGTEKSIFEHAAVVGADYSDLGSDSAPPERISSAAVSEDFFETLGAPFLLGRDFTAADHLQGAERTMVLSERLWRRRFNSDPNIVGRRLRLRGVDRFVIGVASKADDFPLATDVWLPIVSSAAAKENVDNFAWVAIARLAPGVSEEKARAFVESVGQRMAHDFPANRSKTGATVISLTSSLVGPQVRDALLVLQAAVLLVLLIAAANLANLLLNRATARTREFAMRSALGASSWRLVRQVMVESVVLSLVGAVFGILLAAVATRLIVRFGPQTIPRLDEASVDARVFLFAIAISLVTGILFALVPALRVVGSEVKQGLQQAASTPSAASHNRVRDCLAVAEIALSLALLIAAGLMLKSFAHLERVDTGVHADNLLTFEMVIPSAVYTSRDKKAQFIADFERRVDSIPGVESAGAVGFLPVGGGGFYLGRAYIIEGQPRPPQGVEYSGMWNVITPGYVKASGLQLLAGRTFTEQDTATSQPVIILSESLAKAMFGKENAVGKYIRSWRDDDKARLVVGVVADVKVGRLDEHDSASAYVPHAQDSWGVLAFVVRTKDTPTAYVPLVRAQLDTLDRNVAMANVSTMRQIRQVALAQPRFNMLLITAFAVMAFTLAVIGLFGVLAYSVSQRTREIGIRMALGAQPANILNMVLRKGVWLTSIGLICGLVVALAGSRLLAGVLFNVQPIDPVVYAVLCFVLGGTALLATYLPARRASAVEPLEALRHE